MCSFTLTILRDSLFVTCPCSPRTHTTLKAIRPSSSSFGTLNRIAFISELLRGWGPFGTLNRHLKHLIDSRLSASCCVDGVHLEHLICLLILDILNNYLLTPFSYSYVNSRDYCLCWVILCACSFSLNRLCVVCLFVYFSRGYISDG